MNKQNESDHLVINADYAELERRIVRIHAGLDRATEGLDRLDKAFKKAAIWKSDPAKQFAADMLNKPYDQVTEDERKRAKNHPLFFMKMYGNHPQKS